MKTYFQGQCVEDWKSDVADRYPEESCGLFVEDNNEIVYIPMTNIHEQPEKHFEMDPILFYKIQESMMIKAVLHSHINYPHVSKPDMVKQQQMKLPWGIINVDKGSLREMFFFGDQLPVQDLIGRPFHHGLYDCYGIIRDFYRLCGIQMIDHPRAFRWWNLKGPNLLTEHYKDNGFYRINEKDIQPGDVAFMNIGAKQVNHAALYLGENLILHHLVNRLSRREPYTNWARKSTFIVRHKDAQKNSLIWELSTKIRRGVLV